jgi:hypothetical protein
MHDHDPLRAFIGISASARISKGQGYRGFFLKLKGREQLSFGQKRAICVVQGRTDRISLLLVSIKCFPLSFNTFKTLYVTIKYGYRVGMLLIHR